MISLIQNSKKRQNSSERKISGCWGPGPQDECKKLTSKEQERHFGGDGYVQYHDCGGGYTAAYIHQNSLNYVFKIGKFHCM